MGLCTMGLQLLGSRRMTRARDRFAAGGGTQAWFAAGGGQFSS